MKERKEEEKIEREGKEEARKDLNYRKKRLGKENEKGRKEEGEILKLQKEKIERKKK